MRKKADSGGSDSVATVVAKKPKKKHKLPPAKKKKLWKAAGAVICLIVAVVFIYSGLMNVNSSFQRAKNSAYNGIYQRAYDSAERRNHVSNYALLSIEDVREISRLEVLTVSDSEFVIKDEDENDKTTSWLEVHGTGVFTVDLSAGEFLVDSQRKYVLVIIPEPVLTECKISDTGEQFWNKGTLHNGSVADGVRLAQDQLSEGRTKLEDAMKQNRNFYDAARKSAVQAIEELVLQWNPNVPDLQVDVKFAEST